MRVIVNGHAFNSLANRLQHLFRVGAGKAHGRSLADAGGQKNRFRAAILQDFGPRRRLFARAAAA